jgi:outer membrane translocation and assembly module TamA
MPPARQVSARRSSPRSSVENDSKVDDDVIRYYIRQHIGEPLDLARLHSDMGTLYGLDYFEQVQYRVVHKGQDHTLVISARGKRSGTDYLRVGLNLSDDMRGDSAFNLGASYRINGINRLGAEWLTRAQIGDKQELYTEFYQPLDVGSRYFVAPYASFEAQNVESYWTTIRSPSTASSATVSASTSADRSATMAKCVSVSAKPGARPMCGSAIRICRAKTSTKVSMR